MWRARQSEHAPIASSTLARSPRIVGSGARPWSESDGLRQGSGSITFRYRTTRSCPMTPERVDATFTALADPTRETMIERLRQAGALSRRARQSASCSPLSRIPCTCGCSRASARRRHARSGYRHPGASSHLAPGRECAAGQPLSVATCTDIRSSPLGPLRVSRHLAIG
jgi:DNA-binding transcriptional ArsR family regulator